MSDERHARLLAEANNLPVPEPEHVAEVLGMCLLHGVASMHEVALEHQAAAVALELAGFITGEWCGDGFRVVDLNPDAVRRLLDEREREGAVPA